MRVPAPQKLIQVPHPKLLGNIKSTPRTSNATKLYVYSAHIASCSVESGCSAPVSLPGGYAPTLSPGPMLTPVASHIMADGLTRIHLTRANVAAGTSYAPRLPTASKSSTSRSVGAAHGSGSTPMPGPHQVQHLPLQTNPSGPPEQDARDTSLTPQPASDGLRGRRIPRSTLNTAQLSPSQQAFVGRLQGRLGREQAAER